LSEINSHPRGRAKGLRGNQDSEDLLYPLRTQLLIGHEKKALDLTKKRERMNQVSIILSGAEQREKKSGLSGQ